MFKVMLVDDEKMVRKGIRMSIDWQRYGVVIASEARDGAEALEKLREEPVDLILSDIRMPVMSGIELARTVKQQYPDVEMVLLSGYEDFACAKEAMALGIRHYLLKPVLADNLVETVSGLRDEEKERRLRRQGEQLRGQLLRASAPLLKSRLVAGMLEGRIGRQELLEQARLLGMELGGPPYAVFAAEVDGYRQLQERLTPSELDAYGYALLNIAEETLAAAPGSPVCITAIRPGRLAGILPMPSGKLSLDALERVAANVHACLGVSIAVGASLPVCGLEDAGRGFVEALAALRQKAAAAGGGVAVYKSSHPEARQPEDAQAALASEADQQACAEETVRKPCAASRLVKEVIRFAAENGDKPIGLAEAADHAGVTAAHLSKVFKEETGTTFIKWLTRHRMEEAQRMLRDSRLRTADIACKVGYQDYKYFSLMFKKHAGMSPRDYRNR